MVASQPPPMLVPDSQQDTLKASVLVSHPGKRQKTSHATADVIATYKAKRMKGNRAARKLMFEDLPFDLLLEIFKYLRPLDLLNMSYSTKELRTILTAGYTEKIWKNAYMNLQPNYFGTNSSKYPPGCPPSVDIRHYTSVLFGETCLFCTRPKAEVVHFGVLTRLCHRCAREHLIPVLRTEWYSHEVFKLCSVSRVLAYDAGGTRRADTWVLRQDYENQELLLQRCIDAEAKTAYKTARLRELSEIQSFGHRLSSWIDEHIREKTVTLSDRAKWLKSKLIEEGYGNDLGKWHDDLSTFPVIQNAVPLNNEGWDLIKYKTLRFIESQKQKARENGMVTVFKKRMACINLILKDVLGNKPKPWIYPSLSTFARLQPFSDVIRSSTSTSGAEEALVWKTVSSLANHVPGILTTWRDDADAFLLSLLSGKEPALTPRIVGEELDRARLELATTFFGCHCCIDPVSYPRILMHRCLRTRRKVSTDNENDDDDTCPQAHARDTNRTKIEPLKEVHGVLTATDQRIWNKLSLWSSPTWSEARQFISLNETATKSAKAIIQACGKDPQSLTAKAMNELDVRIECKRCGPTKGKSGTAEPRSRLVMNWNTAILHDITHHPDDISREGWRLITSEADSALVAEYENKILRRGRFRSYERCRHCDVSVKTGSTAKLHLQRKHKIETDKLQEHIYTLLDMPMSGRRSLVKI